MTCTEFYVFDGSTLTVNQGVTLTLNISNGNSFNLFDNSTLQLHGTLAGSVASGAMWMENTYINVYLSDGAKYTVPGRTFTGTVTEKGVTADAMSRSYEVRALVQNGDHALLPGMVCTLKTDYEQGERAIFLPANIVQIDADNRTFVWIAVGGKAKKAYITTGEENAQGVMVLTGLSDGDEVIVSGSSLAA